MLTRLLQLALLAFMAAAGWMLWFALGPVTLVAPRVEFSILPGSSLRSATRQIRETGIAVSAWEFNLMARMARSETTIKAGSYEVSEGVTPWQLLKKITQGDYTLAEVTFIEGWTFRQISDALASHPDVRHELKGLTEGDVMTRLGSPDMGPEGWFFPDTYLFAKGASDVAILSRAHRAMQKRLESAWSSREPDTPVRSSYEALILASIVEKETGRPEDRTLIAGVFINRMRAGMKLQTDPTVIYGLGERFDGNLRKRDLITDTPFNTYTRAGLPPAPIAMPGLASLQAVLHPARTNALYFVARGDGTSQFSQTLDEHNRAVAHYQKGARGNR